MPPPNGAGGIPPEVLSLLNANNAMGNGNGTGNGDTGLGPADAYRSPMQAQHMSPPRQEYRAPNASLSPRVSTNPGPAGGIPGLPPKPADALPPAQNAASEVGNLLAMLVRP